MKPTDVCRSCSTPLIPGENWPASRQIKNSRVCTPCHSKYVRGWESRNRERHLAKHKARSRKHRESSDDYKERAKGRNKERKLWFREYALTNSERVMLTTARNRAKKQSLPFNITEDDIKIPIFCPALGLKLERGIDGTGRSDASPSLDRIIPELGYVKGNVVVVSNKANRMKNNGTVDELVRIAAFYSELTKELPCPNKNGKTGAMTSETSMASPTPKLQKTPTKNTPTLLMPLPRSGNNVALIDGDIFAYAASFGSENVIDLGDDIVHLEADLDRARTSLEDMIGEAASKVGAKQIIVALTDDNENFRKKLLPGAYKEDRTLVRKPLALRHIKEHLKTKYGAKIKPTLEADDVLGILGSHPTLVKGKPIIITTDKDLLQIPGRHYNPRRDEKRIVSEEEGDLWFYTQVLTGDQVDNYPGVPGIGPKRAAVILAQDGEPWDLILTAYLKAGLDSDYAITQARVARILRHTDYDFKRKEPILWSPSS